jgi:hypothetical protein
MHSPASTDSDKPFIEIGPESGALMEKMNHKEIIDGNAYLSLNERIQTATHLAQLHSINANLTSLLKHKKNTGKTKDGSVLLTLNRKNTEKLRQAIQTRVKQIIIQDTNLSTTELEDTNLTDLRTFNPKKKCFSDKRMVALVALIKAATCDGYGSLLHAALKGREFHKALRQPRSCWPTRTWRLIRQECLKTPAESAMIELGKP